MNVRGKLAVVTGGARRVGRAIVEGLAHDGAHVVIHCHSSLDEARDLARQVGGEVVQADLAQPEGAEHLARQVLQLEGELAVWVNAAATFSRRSFLDGDDGLWRDAMQLVLLSPAAIVRRVAPTMVPGGVVINVLDVAAHQAWKGYAHHCVAKAALSMLTRCLALELAPRLRVCGISPGVVLVPDDLAAPQIDRMVGRIPMGRVGSPEDVVQAVRYLVQGDYLTGTVLAVDGGLTSRGHA